MCHHTCAILLWSTCPTFLLQDVEYKHTHVRPWISLCGSYSIFLILQLKFYFYIWLTVYILRLKFYFLYKSVYIVLCHFKWYTFRFITFNLNYKIDTFQMKMIVIFTSFDSIRHCVHPTSHTGIHCRERWVLKASEGCNSDIPRWLWHMLLSPNCCTRDNSVHRHECALPPDNLLIHSTAGSITCLEMAAAPDNVNSVLNVIACSANPQPKTTYNTHFYIFSRDSLCTDFALLKICTIFVSD